MLQRASFACLLTVTVYGAALMPASVAANVPQAHGIVASHQLARHPNSVLLSFLVDDCVGCLPDDLQQQAIAQITNSLRQQTLVNPMEQVRTLMGGALSPASMLKQAFSPSNMMRGALGAGAAAGSAHRGQALRGHLGRAIPQLRNQPGRPRRAGQGDRAVPDDPGGRGAGAGRRLRG